MQAPPADPEGDTGASVRVDRWLLAVRAFKTRPLAQAACRSGKVSIDGRTAAPDRPVHRSELVAIRTPLGERRLRVVELGVRRVSPAEARLLYSDETPPATATAPAEHLAGLRERGAGRPTKRDRRATDRLRER